MPSPEARQRLLIVARDQLARAVSVPVRREESHVMAIGKPLVEQRNDFHVGFRVDEKYLSAGKKWKDLLSLQEGSHKISHWFQPWASIACLTSVSSLRKAHRLRRGEKSSMNSATRRARVCTGKFLRRLPVSPLAVRSAS